MTPHNDTKAVKRYKLLKDLPWLKAGTVFWINEHGRFETDGHISYADCHDAIVIYWTDDETGKFEPDGIWIEEVFSTPEPTKEAPTPEEMKTWPVVDLDNPENNCKYCGYDHHYNDRMKSSPTEECVVCFKTKSDHEQRTTDGHSFMTGGDLKSMQRAISSPTEVAEKECKHKVRIGGVCNKCYHWKGSFPNSEPLDWDDFIETTREGYSLTGYGVKKLIRTVNKLTQREQEKL